MAHNSTVWQSEALYKAEDHSDNERAQGAPLDLRHTILISPAGALEKEMARLPWGRLSGRHLLTLREGNNELEDRFEELLPVHCAETKR